ncbi:sensor histidine kinase [Cohnella rhizosphaerae]|uniref:Histidine kinase n=1 Tax=Cohnella rhizosphaerae TaxID=1457232 RepID=A0A9X4KPH5_9BACL|nr:histidine kinase [Cohnella rhizosphaerae]MDG0808410.1 histidine kinase [Cohnella rhizosphaerae]
MKLRNSLQAKVFFFYSLVFVAITIMASVPAYLYLKKGIEKNALNNIDQTVATISGKLDTSWGEFNSISKQAYLSTGINGRTVIQYLELLAADGKSYDTYESGKAVDDFLGLIAAIYNDIHRISIVTAQNAVYLRPSVRQLANRPPDDPAELDAVRRSSGETLLRYRDKDYAANPDDVPVFVFSRLLNPKQNKIGVIEMQIEVAKLIPLEQLAAMPGSRLLVTAGDRVVYARADDRDGEATDGEAPDAADAAGQNEYAFRQTAPKSGLSVVLTVPRAVVFAKLDLFRNVAVATVVVLILFSVAVFYYLSRVLTQPLVKLKNAIDSIDLQDAQPKIDNKFRMNEIQKINFSFRNMNDRLQHSLEKIVRFRTLQLQSQFDTLQAQINPHFLFNMLGIIQASAESGQLEQVNMLSRNLSEFMRYSISMDSPTTTLDKEASFTAQYLELMKTRYMHLLEYEFDLDPDMLFIFVPKLILQPLVENAIKHGFGGNARPLRISVVGRLEGEWWELRVLDNGAGFSDEGLAAVNGKIESSLARLDADFEQIRLDLGGMGMVSTIVRMKLQFRHQFRYAIGNRPGGGAQIMLRGTFNG